jgi:hypothetical protein
MEYYNDKLCITHAELTDGIMPYKMLGKYQCTGKIEQVRRGCRSTPALFAVDSLPLKYKTEVYRRYPDMKAIAESKPFEESIEPDGAAMSFYQGYQFDDGKYLSLDKQREYANNAAILNAFRVLLERSNSARKGHKRVSRSDFWQKAARALPRLADAFPNSLPENPRRLQEKFTQYTREGHAALITGKFGTRNAAVIATPDQQAILVKVIANPLNHDNVQQANKYNECAAIMGWKPITPAAVATWKKKLDLVTTAARLGEKRFDSERAMQVTRSAPDSPLKFWTLDGWTAELFYQKEGTYDGRRATTYMNRLVIVVVLDPCGKYPIGYAIGERENTELTRAALRNAVNHTAELFGRRYRVNQLQYDNFLSKVDAMTQVFSAVADKTTPAAVGNAKSKVIEPYFKHLNKTYCQQFPNWSGFGVTANKNNQPNGEFLKKYSHSFPDEEGCRRQLVAFVEKERAAKREKYVALFANLPDERRLPLSDEQYLFMFGEETGNRNALVGAGLCPVIGGIKRKYDCFDPKFREYAHVHWSVKYDPDNLDKALAVNEDGTLRFMLERKHVQPMALVDHAEGDAAQLARVNDFNNQLKEGITNFLGDAHDRAVKLIEDNPRLNKANLFMITDSLGRHKIHKYPRPPKSHEIDDVAAIEVATVKRVAPPPVEEDAWNLY